MTMQLVTLRNVFHGTEVRVRSGYADPTAAWFQLQYLAQSGWQSDRAKLRRIERALCGIKGCQCGTFRPK
jgi:hypothetical protein